MNPWEGIASPADSPIQGVVASPWEGIASPVETAPKVSTQDNESPNPGEGFWQYEGRSLPRDLKNLGRGVGLGLRYTTEGAMALPSLVANIPAATANATTYLADKALGTDAHKNKMPYVNIGDMLSYPEPENAKERLAGDVIRSLSGAGASTQIGANALKSGSEFIGPKLAEFLSARPDIQAQSAVGSGLASGGAREIGGSPLTQAIAGLAGGIAAPASVGAAKGALDLVRPFTEGGRNQLASNIIASHADDPAQAAASLTSVPQYVPGSMPTGGTSSNDLGLIGMEKTLMQNPSNYFGERLGEQNAARTDFINQVAGDETTIPRYTEMRSAATAPLYQEASQVKADPQALGNFLSGLDKKISDVGPKSAAGETLIGIKSDIESTLPKAGVPNQYFTPNKPVPPEIPQSQLVQLYRETRDNLNKTGMQPGAYGSSVRGIIKPANQQLGAALEAENPKLAEANALFEQLSAPIDQAKNMQTLVPRMTGGQQDLQGNFIYQPSKVGNIVKSGEMPTEYNGVQALADALSPEQHQALTALNQDLQRSNAVNIPMVRPPGSNTFNNTASTAELTNSLAGKIAQHVPFFKEPYKATNQKILQAIANKMLDPEMTREALLSGKPIPNETLIQALLRSSAAASKGMGIAAATSVGGRQ